MHEILPEVPFRIELEVINVCNKRCDYCYADTPFDGYAPPAEHLRYFIDKTEREVRPFEVIILGGEPFLRKDMVDLMEYAADTFSVGRVSISSNGTVFRGMKNEDIGKLKKLSDNGSVIQVSIDSATNIKAQKGPDSYEGMKVLESKGVSFRAGIVLTRQNYEDCLNTISMLLDFSGLSGINLEPLQRISEAHFNANALTPHEMLEMKDSVAKLIMDKKRQDIQLIGITESAGGKLQARLMERKNTGVELRGSRITNGGVYANGDVSMNGALGRANVLGNLMRDDWKSIWCRARRVYENECRGLVVLEPGKDRLDARDAA